MNLIITNRAKKDLAKLDRETAQSVTRCSTPSGSVSLRNCRVGMSLYLKTSL